MGWMNPVRMGLLVSVVGGLGGRWVCAQTAEETDLPAKKWRGAEGLLARGQYDLARQEFDEFLKLYPQDARVPEARYDRAVCEMNLNDPRAAIADLIAASAQPFNRRDEALSLLGTLYLQQGQVDKALASLDLLVKDYPHSPQVESAQVNRAQALYRLGKFDPSLDAVRQFVGAFPKSGYRAAALYVGALDQRKLGDEKEAERTLREIVTVYPNSPFVDDAQLLIGESLAAQGRTDEAIAHYQQLETQAPESRKAAVEFGLATAFLRGGKYAEADQTFDHILRDYPASAYVAPATLQRAIVQLKAGRRNDASAALAAIAGQFPQLAPSAAYWLARCDLLDGKFDAAARQLEKLAGVPMPEAPDVDFDLAYCQLRLGHDAVALERLEAYRAAYPRSPQLPDALYEEATALYHLGRFAEAVTFCDAVDKFGATALQRPAAMLKAESLLMLKQYAPADAAFASLEQSAPTDEERLRLKFRRGQCAYFAGDYAAAENRLADVVRIMARGDPSLREAIFLLGDAELQQGQDAQAEETLKQYLAAGASADRSQEAMFKLATAQQHLKEDGAAAETLHEMISGAGSDLATPWAQRAWFNYGQLAFERGDADTATQAMQKVLAAKPESSIAAPALYLLARIEMAGDDAAKNDQAAGHLETLLQRYPHDALAQDAAFVRGIALRNAHRPEDADRQLSAYLQRYPTGRYAADARHQRALALTASKNPASIAQAVQMLADLAHGPARSDSILYDLAWAYRAGGENPKAVDAYQALLKEFPNGTQAAPARVELAQMLYAQKQYAAASVLLESAIADPRAGGHLHGVAVYWMACCAARLGDDARAAPLFDAFVAANPHDPLAADALGEAGAAYAALNKFDQAERRQRQVIADFPNSAPAALAVIRLGEVQNQAGDYPAAAATLTQWLKDNPHNPFAPRAHFGIGWSLENRGQLDAARAQYAQVIAADNGDVGARAQFQIGETYFTQKQYAAAARELLKVDILYNAPQWAARALYEAGRAFEQLHDPARARQQFAACLAKYKGSDVAPLARQHLDTLSTPK